MNAPCANSESAHRYIKHARQRSEKPDDLLNFVLGNIGDEDTVLDIGAGTGRWSIPIARTAKSVTALEPSAAMQDVLRENIDAAHIHNIRIVSSSWQESAVESHDIIVCAHAMYSSPDFSSFIRKMEQWAEKTCYLALRVPPQDGIIGELSFSIYGRYHDSPNAIIAYNALYSMGIYVNVFMGNSMFCWENRSIDEAFDRAKRHLHLESSAAYDKLIRETLVRRLNVSNESYVWPDGMRSALLWWTPSNTSNNRKKSSGD
jgi:SAM-dependent methyltransferase